jgi:hypothetical protein
MTKKELNLKLKNKNNLIDIIVDCMETYRNISNQKLVPNTGFKHGKDIPEFHMVTVPNKVPKPLKVLKETYKKYDDI